MQLYLKMKDTPKVRKLRVASLYYTTKAKQKNNKLLGGRHNMPPPFSSLSRHRSASRRRADRACRPKRSSRFPRSICSHGYRCSSWRVNAAVSKGSWWPWPLTSWPWKWCPSHVWRGLSLCHRGSPRHTWLGHHFQGQEVKGQSQKVKVTRGDRLYITGTGGDGFETDVYEWEWAWSYGYRVETGLEAMGMGRDRVRHLSPCSSLLCANFSIPSLSVLDLGPKYATDRRQTGRQTSDSIIA